MKDNNNRQPIAFSFRMAAGLIGLLMAGMTFNACQSTHQKVLEGDDYGKKMEFAERYMEEGEYSRAKPMLNDLIDFYRGTEKVIELYFQYAEAQFETGNYLMASHYYQTLAETFPDSELAEKSLFRHAYSLYQVSPRPSLDQSNTRRAINAFQLFVNRHPQSDLVERSHQYMDELREKLEIKAFNNARHYYQIHDYRAAKWAFGNFLEEYPGSDRREEAEYLIFKSAYRYADKSVEEKRAERFRDAVQYYERFIERYPDSDKREEAEEMYQSAKNFLNEETSRGVEEVTN